MTTTDNNDHDRIDRFIASYLLHLDGEADRPDLGDLPEEDRAEAAARIDLLDGLRSTAVEAPAGAAGRIARTLGLDRAGSRISVSGPRLKRARDARGLTLKDIAAAATNAGTPIRTADLLRIESATTTPVDQQIVTVLVAILDISVDDVEDDFATEVSAMRAFLDGPEFDDIVAGWAAEHGRDLEATRATVRDRALALQFRAEDTTTEQLADMVRAILRSLE